MEYKIREATNYTKQECKRQREKVNPPLICLISHELKAI